MDPKAKYALKILFPEEIPEHLRADLLSEFFQHTPRQPITLFWRYDLNDPVGLVHGWNGGSQVACSFTDTTKHGREILAQGDLIPWSGCVGAAAVRTCTSPLKYAMISLGLILWEDTYQRIGL